jgi:hypothetical protein
MVGRRRGFRRRPLLGSTVHRVARACRSPRPRRGRVGRGSGGYQHGRAGRGCRSVSRSSSCARMTGSGESRTRTRLYPRSTTEIEAAASCDKRASPPPLCAHPPRTTQESWERKFAATSLLLSDGAPAQRRLSRHPTWRPPRHRPWLRARAQSDGPSRRAPRSSRREPRGAAGPLDAGVP